MRVKGIMTMVIRTAKIVIVGFLVIGMVYAMTNGMVKDYFEETVGAVVSKADEMSNGGTGSSGSLGGNYEAAFADNTWDEIAAACKQKTVPSTWSVGDTKEMDINGTSYTVAIIGKNHDTYADGSGTAPLTFQVIDIVENRQMNSSKTNSGSWGESALYSYLQNDMLNSLEDDVKNSIKAVAKKTNLGGNGTGNNTTTETSSDKLFLLSVVEVYGTSSSIRDNEGIRYDYYNQGATMLNYNGMTSSWWLRTPYSYNYDVFYYVGESSVYNYIDYATASYGVSFGFCF